MEANNNMNEPDRRYRLSASGPVVCAILGALYAVVGAFPMAAFVALVFRFPIPFGGYESGIEAMVTSPIAVIFYGLIGGFPILAMLGAVAGGIAFLRHKRRKSRHKHWEVLIFAVVIDFVAVILMAVWDKIYGPW